MKKGSLAIFTIMFFFLSGLLAVFKEPLVERFATRPSLSELENPELVEAIKKQSGDWQAGFSQPVFLNAPAPYPLAQASETQVLGEAKASGEKWIEIDLSEQRLYAHEGDKVIYTFLVSTGKWAPTPKGDFRIWIKLRYSTMSGGNKADGTYYYLPNVPYVMFFHNGFGLHGTYWHNNFGTPMSHGCVNLSVIDAEKLFWWTEPSVPSGKNVVYPTKDNPGTRVVIHD